MPEKLLGKLLVYKMPEGIASGMIIEVASCAGSNDKGRTPMETGNSAGLLVSPRNSTDMIFAARRFLLNRIRMCQKSRLWFLRESILIMQRSVRIIYGDIL